MNNLKELDNFHSDFYHQNQKMYQSSGRGIDDIGNELECLNSNLDSDYLFLHKEYRNGKSQLLRLSHYLRRNYTFLGLCIPQNCSSFFKDLVEVVNNRGTNGSNTLEEDIDIQDEYDDFVYSFFGNNTKEIKLLKRDDIEKSNLLTYIQWFLIILFLIKVTFGINAKLFFPKGYNFYVKTRMKFDENNEDTEKESEDTKLISDDYTDEVNQEFNLKGEYDPKFDFEPNFPFYIRIIKCLDLFNNISTFMKKRNRYYNEKNINILCSIKSILLFYHIYTETIRVLIRLPNTNSFDYSYYSSLSFLLFKRSTYSLIFWVILESATFSFKLMSFIKQIFNKNKKNDSAKRYKISLVIKQILKFLLFYIPKIVTFIFIYVFFYYLFDYYNSKLEAKMTYKFISDKIIKNKYCNLKEKFLSNLLYTFIPFMNYFSEHILSGYYTICFPFTYIYINMFYSSIFFMILLMIIFYFQKKIIDVLMFIAIMANLIGSYIYYFYNDYIKKKNQNHKQNENKSGLLYTFGYFSGENYSIFYLHIFFSYYFIGCLLGLNIYNLGENKNKKLEAKRTKRKNESIIGTSRRKSTDKNDIDNEKDSLYEPMEFCSTFILKLKKMKTISKFVLLLIYIALSTLLIFIIIILFNSYIKEIEESDINTSNISHKLMILYYWDKIINVILFSFFILLISVIKKKFLLIKILKSNFFIPISRVGFFVTCGYQSMVFIFFCLFQLRIKNAFFIILYIAIGFYILIIIFSLFITILIELPFRIIIKNIVKSFHYDKADALLNLINK